MSLPQGKIGSWERLVLRPELRIYSLHQQHEHKGNQLAIISGLCRPWYYDVTTIPKGS